MIRKIILNVGLLFMFQSVNAQILKPIKWSFAIKNLGNSEAIVFIKATIDGGWHIYSQKQVVGGPVATHISFFKSKEFDMIGKILEPKPIQKYDQIYKMNVFYFEREVVFQQRIKLKSTSGFLKGSLEYMACDNNRCIPPDEIEFNIPLNNVK